KASSVRLRLMISPNKVASLRSRAFATATINCGRDGMLALSSRSFSHERPYRSATSISRSWSFGGSPYPMVMLPTVSPSTLIGAAYRLIPPLQGMSTGFPAFIQRIDASRPDSRQCHLLLAKAARLSVVPQRSRDVWSRNRHQSDATRHEAYSPFLSHTAPEVPMRWRASPAIFT